MARQPGAPAPGAGLRLPTESRQRSGELFDSHLMRIWMLASCAFCQVHRRLSVHTLGPELTTLWMSQTFMHSVVLKDKLGVLLARER